MALNYQGRGGGRSSGTPMYLCGLPQRGRQYEDWRHDCLLVHPNASPSRRKDQMSCAVLTLSVPRDFFGQQNVGGREVFPSERCLWVGAWGPWASFLLASETSHVSNGGSVPRLAARKVMQTRPSDGPRRTLTRVRNGSWLWQDAGTSCQLGLHSAFQG